MICTIIDCAPAMATTPQSGAKLSETGMQLSVPDPSGSLMDALLNMQALLTEGMQHGHGEFWVGLSFFLVLFFGLFILQRLAGVQSELRSMQGMLSAPGRQPCPGRGEPAELGGAWEFTKHDEHDEFGTACFKDSHGAFAGGLRVECEVNGPPV